MCMKMLGGRRLKLDLSLSTHYFQFSIQILMRHIRTQKLLCQSYSPKNYSKECFLWEIVSFISAKTKNTSDSAKHSQQASSTFSSVLQMTPWVTAKSSCRCWNKIRTRTHLQCLISTVIFSWKSTYILLKCIRWHWVLINNLVNPHLIE